MRGRGALGNGSADVLGATTMFDLNRDRGLKIVIDLGRAPDNPGKRADINHALRLLQIHGMIEWLEWSEWPKPP